MDTTVLALLILLALPAALILIAGGAYLLTLRWKLLSDQAAEESAQLLGETIRKIEGLRRIAGAYSQAKVEPYLSLVGQLQEQADALENTSAALVGEWEDLGDPPAPEGVNPLQLFTQSVPETNRRFHDATRLLKRSQANRQELEKTLEIIKILDSVPGNTARRTERAGAALAEWNQRSRRLELTGLAGDQFAQSREALHTAWSELDAIPLRFKEFETFEAQQPPAAPEAEPSASAEAEPSEKESSGAAARLELQHQSGAAYERLGRLEPLIEEWLPQLQEWDEQASLTAETTGRLRSAIEALHNSLDEAPTGLDKAEFQAALAKIDTAEAELERRRGSADAGQLKALERESALLEKTVAKTQEEFDQTSDLSERLAVLIHRIQSDMNELDEKMALAETRSVYPLAWEVSLEKQGQLEESLVALGEAEEARSAEKIRQMYADGQYLQQDLSSFSREIDQICARHSELISLLGSENLVSGGSWLRKSAELAQKTADFAPENWGKGENISSFAQDMQAMAEAQQKLVQMEEAEQRQPIGEGDLQSRLEELRGLAGRHTEERARTERVRSRLEELQAQTVEAGSGLEKLAISLDQVELLTRSNAGLKETADHELAKLNAEMEKLRGDLNQSQTGLLEKKIQRLQGLKNQFAKAINGWVKKIAGELESSQRQLAAQLGALDKLAILDDREAVDARRLLERLGADPQYQAEEDYEKGLVELKRCVQDWQTSLSVTAALHHYALPVLDAAKDLQGVRERAKSLYHPSSGLSSSRSEWPPARQIMEGEIEEYRALEQRIEDMRKEHWTAARLIREAGLLFTGLDRLCGRAEEGVRQSEEERARAASAEREVMDLTKIWMGISRRYQAEFPQVSMAARDLTVKADQRMQAYRSQYRRGSLDYDQVLAGLRDLADTLRNTAYPTGENHEINIDS